MRAIVALLAFLLVAPASAAAQPSAAPSSDGGTPIGVVVTAGVGGGTSVAGGSQYTPSGVFEGEVTAGYEVGAGFRPELGVGLGVAPKGHLALRPGLHYAVVGSPFYVRGALDWSTLKGSLGFRWLLAGGGVELRVTDVLGGFAEADLGIPFQRDTGLGVLVRAGASFRF